VTCWNCHSPVSERFCPQCKALQPPPSDYFEFFGLPRFLSIDAKDLETRFYALSRKLHPDLFSRKSAQEREYSLESTAILNDAYRTLRDPIARSQYLLKQEGFDVGEQSTKDVPADLLEEVFELNMALEEGEQDEIAQLRTRFQSMLTANDAGLQELFAVWDAKQDRATLTELRALLNKRKYITNLIERTNVSD
jgi:molecular chaperone HscB